MTDNIIPPGSLEIEDLKPAATGSGGGPALMVDLGDVYPIAAVVYARPGLGDSTGEFSKLALSRDGGEWDLLAGIRPTAEKGRMCWVVNGERIARYLKIFPLNSDGTGRIQVYAAQSGLTIVQVRRDGLAVRLLATMNALYLAKILGGRMKMTWPVRQANYNFDFEKAGLKAQAIDGLKAEELFSADFCREHLLDETWAEDFPKYLPGKSNLGRKELLDPALEDQPGRLFSTFEPLSQFLNEHLRPNRAWGLRQMFAALPFQPGPQEAIELARQAVLPDRFTAIHIRNGDLLYNDYFRDHCFFSTTYGIPIQLAKMAIEHVQKQGRKIVLFSEDLKVLKILSKTYGVRSSADSLPRRPGSLLETALFELVLMSRAETICGGVSHYSKCAAGIGGDVEFVDMNRMFSHDQKLAYFQKDLRLNEREYPSLQNAHSYAWLYYYFWDKEGVDGLALLNKALGYDPESKTYRIFKAVEFFKKGDYVAGEKELAGLPLIIDREKRTFIYERRYGDPFHAPKTALLHQRSTLDPIENAARKGYPYACFFMALICYRSDRRQEGLDWKEAGLKAADLAVAA